MKRLVICVALLSVAACESSDYATGTSATSSDYASDKQTSGSTDEMTETGDVTSSAKSTDYGEKSYDDEITTGKDDEGGNDDNGLTPELAEIIFFETLLSEQKEKFMETSIADGKASDDTDVTSDGEKGSGAELTPESSDVDTNSPPEGEQIRRTGDVSPDYADNRRTVQYEEPQRDSSYPPPPPLYPPRRGPPRNRASSAADSDVPLFQLTQGGYHSPYQQLDDGQRVVQESAPTQSVPPTDGGSNNLRSQIVSQVTYTPPISPPQYAFGPGPMLRSPFVPTTFMNANGILPNNIQGIQGPFLNPPQQGFGDFQANSFQQQFPATANDIAGFPAFARDPALFQPPPRAMYNPSLLFQNPPQFVQPQPVPNDPTRTFQPTFANFDTVEDSARPDYAAYFRSPAQPVNPQFQMPQIPPNFYATSPATRGGIFNNPPISLLSNYPRPDDGFASRYIRYPLADSQSNSQGNAQPNEKPTTGEDQKAKDGDQINESPNKQDPTSVPYGTRLQRQNEGQLPDDVYIRYPMREAGYATEENLPSQNSSKEGRNSDSPQPQAIPFFQLFSSRDPYRDALNKLQQGSSPSDSNSNGTYDFPNEQVFRASPISFNYPQPPSQVLLTAYPERNQDTSRFPSTSFYPAAGVDRARVPFQELTSLPEGNYRFFSGLPERPESSDLDVVPQCAQTNNASMCFEDTEYPRRDILYAVNSDSFLLDRLALPMADTNLVEANATDETKAEENYICKSDIKYGAPLRAKNVSGKWKIIVNMEQTVGRGRFTQPLRLEVCRGSGDPCSYTDSRVKTTCVQKYSLHRLLSWSQDRGIHNDVFKFPVACSCQIVEALQA